MKKPLLPRPGSLTLRKKQEIQSSDIGGLQPKEYDLWKGSGGDYEFCDKAMDRDLKSFVDDGLCELQPDHYFYARLSPMMRSYNLRARHLGRLVKTSQVIMTMLTASTTLFAAIKKADLRPIVPIVVALSALVSQCSEYERLPTRLVNVRKSIENLMSLQVWWEGLSPSERRQSANKAKLVITTEEQADAEISAWKKSSQTNDHGPQGGQAKQDDPKQKQPPT